MVVINPAAWLAHPSKAALKRLPVCRYRMLFVVIVLIGLLGGGLRYRSFATADEGSPSGCGTAAGPFSEGKTRIFQANKKPYVPYGLTVPGLAYKDYQDNLSQMSAQIDAAAASWCVNTVRLQVAPYDLIGRNGHGYSAAFMTALQNEVKLAESYHLVVVISAQYEAYGHTRNPTANTAQFWKDVCAVYGADPQVVLDLYNEPQIDTGNAARTWQIWRNGGTYDGSTYLGMQDLVSDVRADGAKNLLWVEGPAGASTLARVGSYLLSGEPLEYDFHHPAGAHDVAAWQHNFGHLLTKGIAPVVDGEWTNWASTRAECWPDARTAVRAYLTYLHGKGIGMTAWALQPGVLIASGNLADPTHIRPDWACADGLDEGAGSLIMQWYQRNNGP